MTRYWKIGDDTLGTSFDDVDLALLEPAAVELDEAAYLAASAAIEAASVKPDPTITDMIGNGLAHVTNAAAKRVVVRVNAPDGGPKRARPTIDGTAVVQGDYTYDRPGKAIEVKTNAGNNDVLVIEEF